jgi:hypothetical protein
MIFYTFGSPRDRTQNIGDEVLGGQHAVGVQIEVELSPDTPETPQAPAAHIYIERAEQPRAHKLGDIDTEDHGMRIDSHAGPWQSVRMILETAASN